MSARSAQADTARLATASRLPASQNGRQPHFCCKSGELAIQSGQSSQILAGQLLGRRVSSLVLSREVFLRLHLDQAALRALELEGELRATIELLDRHGGGDDQLHGAVVELIDE